MLWGIGASNYHWAQRATEGKPAEPEKLRSLRAVSARCRSRSALRLRGGTSPVIHESRSWAAARRSERGLEEVKPPGRDRGRRSSPPHPERRRLVHECTMRMAYQPNGACSGHPTASPGAPIRRPRGARPPTSTSSQTATNPSLRSSRPARAVAGEARAAGAGSSPTSGGGIQRRGWTMSLRPPGTGSQRQCSPQSNPCRYELSPAPSRYAESTISG